MTVSESSGHVPSRRSRRAKRMAMLPAMSPALPTNSHSNVTGHHTPGRTSTARAFITRRWPAALAVISALLFFGDGETPPLESFAAILVFMPVAYLVFGWARRELAEARALAIQFAGLVAYSVLAFAAVVLENRRPVRSRSGLARPCRMGPALSLHRPSGAPGLGGVVLRR